MLIKEYDLRGIFNKEIKTDLVKKVVEQFVNFTNKEKILLAIDPNPKSLIIKDFLEKEFKNKFDFLGPLPTPIFYYFVIKRKNPGIMITASHLPLKYVGLKFLLEDGSSWKPKIEKKNWRQATGDRQQTTGNWQRLKKIELKKLIKKELYQDYFEKLKKIIKPKKIIKVNFDLNNFFLKISSKYFKDLKIKHSQNSKIKIKADLDNDRIIILYKNKQVLPDLIFFLISQTKKYQKLGVPIFFSKYLEKKLKKTNKKIFYIKTGHYYYKKAFKKYNLDLAFEPTGHFYLFKDLKTEAPYLALVLFLQNFNEENLKEISRSFTLIRKNLDSKKESDLKKVINSLKKEFKLKLKKFDGYLLYQKNFYLHLRKSKTEPNKLRISLEIIKNGSTGRNYEKNF